MAGGFEIAKGYVEVEARVDDKSLQDVNTKIEKSIERGGLGAGQKAGKAAGKGIDEGATAGGKRAGKNVGDEIEKALVERGKRAGKSLGDEIDKSVTATGQHIGKNLGDEIARDAKGPLAKTGNELGDTIGEGVKKGLVDKAREDKLRSAMKLANASGWVAQGGALGAGLGAGVAAGLVGVVATAVPIALAGAFLAGDEQLGSAVDDLFNRVQDGGTQAAQVLKGPLLSATRELSESWARMEPTLGRMFEDAVPSVAHLTRGITGLAENTLAGMAKAVSRSETTMSGFGTMLERTGTGLGNFFDNSTKHSLASGQVLAHFGTLAEMALGSAGNAIDKLSAAYAPHAAQVETFFHQAGAVISEFSGTAIPMLMDMGGTTLTVFSAALKVIAPFASELGAVAGAVLPVYSAMKLLNTVITPVTALIGKGGLGAAMASSTASGGGLLATLGGLVTKFPAVSIAAGATAAILGTYFLEQKKVSDFGDNFAQGMQAGGDAAKKAATDYGNVARELGELTKRRDEWNAQPDVIAMGADDAKGSAMNDQILAHNQLLGDAKKKYDDLHASLGPLGQRQLELNRAVAEHGAASAEAMAASAAYQAQKESDVGTENTLKAAMQGVNDAYMARQANITNAMSSELGYRNAVAATTDAQKAYTDALSAHGIKSKEAQDAGRALESAQLAQAEAAKQQATATSTATNEQSRGVAGTAAYNAEILKMAASTNGVWTPSMQTAISTMSATELATIGVRREIDATGQAVYRLPDGKPITIVANTQAAKDRLDELQRYQVRDKFFTVTMHQVVDSVGAPIAGSNRSSYKSGAFDGSGGAATGGTLIPGQRRMVPQTKQYLRHRATGGSLPVLSGMANTTVVGENGPERIFPTQSAYVATALQTARMERAMATVARGMSAPPVASAHSGTPVVTQIHHHWTVQAPIDLDALAAKVSRRQRLDQRGGY